MIVYKDPDTGYMCKCSLPSSVPDGIAFKEVPSHERDDFNDAIDDYDVDGNPVFDMVKAKAIKVKTAQRLAADAMKAITENYEPHEIATWDIQETEARNEVPVGYLSMLASQSGIPLADLRTKVIANADAYRVASATAVGKRQGMEAACMAANTLDDLKAVEF